MFFQRLSIRRSDRTLGRQNTSGWTPRNSLGADEFGNSRLDILLWSLIEHCSPRS
jgi:hypothetical protein